MMNERVDVRETATQVPIRDGDAVRIEPGQPWPSAYRGSEYSLVTATDHDGPQIKWEHRDLTWMTNPPNGLRDRLQTIGKENGTGSFRLTADREVLAKVPAEDYDRVAEAPVESGWIPVYVGELTGPLQFEGVETDPLVPTDSAQVWPGFPFSHGERWSVDHTDRLIWTWRDYRFHSAFQHPELVAAYDRYRNQTGRFYITENGHVWITLPQDGIERAKETEVKEAVADWKSTAEANNDVPTLRLVQRRLEATSPGNNSGGGHLPLHIGHLEQFDDGRIPRPIVDDPTYFKAMTDYETVWE